MVGIWGIARRPASRALQSIVAVTTMTVAATGQTFPLSVQGKLTGVPDGQQSMTLKIWDTASDGNEVASVPFSTSVAGGVFSATVDTPESDFNGANRWWNVQIGAAQTERQRVASVPYAMAASTLLAGATTLGPLSVAGALQVEGMADGSPLLIFNLERPWLFEQRGAGPAAKLVLRDDSGGKTFEVQAQSGSPLATFNTSNMAVGIRTSSPQAALDVRGRIQSEVLTITGGSDLAEPFSESTDSDIEAKPGMVMSIDPENPGALRVASRAYDTRVAGVYSGGNGLNTGMIMGQEGCELTSPGENKVPVAMTGRVWVYADESGGEIRPGDRLTTSGTKPGHAMKVTDDTRSIGTVIGKAMTAVDPDSGMVMVLVNLQ